MVGGFGERVDFDLGRVFFVEDGVEFLDGVFGIFNVLFVEVKFLSNVVGYFVGDIGFDIDIGGVDGIRVFFGDSFNVDIVLGGGDNDGSLRGMVYEDGKVEFVMGEFVFVDVDGIVKMVIGISLFGDEFVVNYLLGEYFGFVGRVDDMDIIFEVVIEGIFIMVIGEDLSFDDYIISVNFLCNSFGFLGSFCDGIFGDINVILCKRCVSF